MLASERRVHGSAGDPASYEKDNRKAWWPGELSLEGGAASSVYRCASHQLTSLRNGQAIQSTQIKCV